jgi:3-hydroxyisobutyrate dehydrogenase-like beta-hydroxyacid dehydrogenase
LELVGADKASIAASPEDIALQCDIIVVNLSSDDVVRKIYTRFNEALKVCIFLSASI